MDDGPTTLDFITLGVALWGAGLSTYIGLGKRRRKVRVSADWDTARLGDIRNHFFFMVSVINTGERAVTVSRIEWISESAGFTAELHVFRHSKGKELPVKVDPDDEVRILFDPDAAAKKIARFGNGPEEIAVVLAGQKRSPTITITDDMRFIAEEHVADLEANQREAEGG